MIGGMIRLFVSAVILGAFIGWAVAWFSGLGSQAQSTYTGYGCGIGAIVGIIVCGAFALIENGTKPEQKDE